ncbi:MAG: hypothetical protein RIS64_382, partial [Bacteroidota bacterium]
RDDAEENCRNAESDWRAHCLEALMILSLQPPGGVYDEQPGLGLC